MQKRAGHELLKASNANPNLPPMKCPSCQGTDHRNSKSKLCPNHSLKIDEEVKARLGNSTEQYCRKIPFESIVRPAMLERLRTNVVTLCFHVREITVRTQVFVNWYILRRIHEDQDVPSYIYNRNCFYSICQLVLGRDITSTNTNMPPDIVSDWRQFSSSYSGSRYDIGSFSGYSDALASQCQLLETIYLNHVVDDFELYISKLCKHKLALANPVGTENV